MVGVIPPVLRLRAWPSNGTRTSIPSRCYTREKSYRFYISLSRAHKTRKILKALARRSISDFSSSAHTCVLCPAWPSYFCATVFHAYKGETRSSFTVFYACARRLFRNANARWGKNWSAYIYGGEVARKIRSKFAKQYMRWGGWYLCIYIRCCARCLANYDGGVAAAASKFGGVKRVKLFFVGVISCHVVELRQWGLCTRRR